MKFESLVCENCGGTDFQRISEDEYLCRHCRGLLIRPKDEKTIKVVYDNFPKSDADAAPKILLSPLMLVVGIFVFSFIGGLLWFLLKGDSKPLPIIANTPRQTATVKPIAIPALGKGTLKTEIIGNVKGGFDDTFIKCLVTNVGENVVERPSVNLTLYRNDVKLGTVSGNADLDYLKPQQTVPIWVNLYDKKNYTFAEVGENPFIRAIDKPLEKLYPQLKYVDTKMTMEIGTSSYNGRLFKEKFYNVTGTVINDFYEKTAPELFVIYYDADSQIIGVDSTHPPSLRKGEKAEFESSKGEKSLFGVPQKFEIIAVDTHAE